ncbi:polysaccharide lyase [Flavisolibacter tropicus]|uniref:polysaccharide lyase n=1 Tax=Flavisolibacter tropicus TaxID=1492898 RepID=UPI0009EF6B5A|nr:polysaccharide lyase [Flavisolibacter tropicus]
MKSLAPYLFSAFCFLVYFSQNSYCQKNNRLMESILLESKFENENAFSQWSLEVCRKDAITVSKVVSRKGKYSLRFEFSKSDPLQYNGYVRAELKQDFKTDETGENWYGFSHYLPKDFVADPVPEVIAQWHEIPDKQLGEDWRSPPISLEIKNDHYFIKVLWASNPVNTNRTKDGELFYDLGPVDKSKWTDWVFHIKFRYDSTGILEVWKNKEKVLFREGPNSYNDQRFPYFKVGIYKWGWAGGGKRSPESTRILYFDEIRVGDRNANLQTVSPF